MIQSSTIINSDTIGAVASTLCFIHCLATPAIFVAKACTATCCADADAPTWWKAIDYLFLVISFVAIYYSTRNTSKYWIKLSLWISWSLLLVTIASEASKTQLIPETFIYFPALSLVVLHFYNLKYCNCSKDNCCTNPQEN